MRYRIAGLLLALLLPACAADAVSPTGAALEILTGPSRVDTVDTHAPEPLIVRVNDARGRPVAGTEVRFALDPDSIAPAALALTASSVRTDEQGLARVRLAFGTTAGLARLRIDAPQRGATISMLYRITPGRPVKLEVPRLTAVPGDTLAPDVYALDAYGNRTEFEPVYDRPTGPLYVLEDGRLLPYGEGLASARVTIVDLVGVLIITVRRPGDESGDGS